MTIHPWTVTSSKYILRDKWLTLRSDDCVTNDGLEIAPFYVLEKQDWAHIVALNQDNQILLVRQYRHGAQKVTLEIPCGVVDNSDRTPLETAKRELLEETGYSAERFQFMYSAYANPARQNNRVHCFLARPVTKIADPTLDASEEIEVEFKNLADVVQLIDNGEFHQTLHIASIYHTLIKSGLMSELLP